MPLDAVSPRAAATATDPRVGTLLHGLFRVSILMEFVGHGAFGIMTKAAWVPYFTVFGIGETAAYRLMPGVGAVDITMGIVGFVSPRRALLAYMTFWGFFTAMLRPLAGEPFWEVLDRAGNYGVPLAFLLYSGLGRGLRQWFEPIRPRPLDPATRARLVLALRATTALFLIGHGAYGALLQKGQLTTQYAAVGLTSLPWVGATFTASLGWLEIALGLAILARPLRGLLLAAASLKVATEMLYPMTGDPIWEFIERGGTYVAPLALFVVLPRAPKRQEGAETVRIHAQERTLLVFATGLFIGVVLGLFADKGGPARAEAPAEIAKAPAAKPLKPDPAPRAVAADLRKGGYLLYFRHGQRDKWNSAIAFDVFEIATHSDAEQERFRDAVCLSPQGREEAKMIGRILDLAGVPVGPIVSSPSCRAKETAELAFGHIDMVSSGLVHTPLTNAANAGAFKEELRRVLTSAPLLQGKNTVISAHGNTLANNKDLFVEGRERIPPGGLSETGFYVIRRDPDGSLRIVQTFQDLGVFAASAIDLQPTGSI